MISSITHGNNGTTLAPPALGARRKTHGIMRTMTVKSRFQTFLETTFTQSLLHRARYWTIRIARVSPRHSVAYDVRLTYAYLEGTITCGQNFEGNSPVTSPAGYVILNSLFGVHTLFEDVYAGVNDAIGTVNGRIGTFVDTYSPIGDDIEDQKRTKLIMDGIQAAMFLILPPTFHSGQYFSSCSTGMSP